MDPCIVLMMPKTLLLTIIIPLSIYIYIILKSTLVFYSDDAIYATLTKYWLMGDWQHVFHPTWPPLYPLLSAFVYMFSHNMENSLRLISALSSTLLLIPIFYLVKKTISDKIALLFILLTAFFNPILNGALVPFSDMLSNMLLTCALVLFYFYLSEDKILYLISSSFFFGLTYLTRAEGSLFATLTLFFLIFYCFFKSLFKKQFSFKILVPLITFVTTFFIVGSPYMLAVSRQIGGWPLSAKFSAQIQQGHAFALNSSGETWAQEIDSVNNPNYHSIYYKNGFQFLLNNLDYLLRWAIEKSIGWQNLFLTIFPIWSIPVILIGFLKILDNKFVNLSYFLFILFTAIPITIFSTSINDIRYLLWTIPILLYFFILGIGALQPKFFKKNVGLVLPILLLLFFPGFFLPSITHHTNLINNFNAINNRPYFLKVASWIKDQPIKNPKIMMRHESIAYYSDGETIYLPQTSYQKMIDYAKRHKVNYLVAWYGELAMDPELSSLMDEKFGHPNLKMVYMLDDPHNKTIVYKLTD